MKSGIKYLFIILAMAVLSLYGKNALAVSNVETFESGGCSIFTCTQGQSEYGIGNWYATSYPPAYSGNYFRSGWLPMCYGSWVTTTVNTASGNISLYYKTYADQYSAFQFTIDGLSKIYKSTTVDWTYASFPVAAGMHTLSWRYDLGCGTYVYDGYAAIDNLTIPLPILTYSAGAGGSLSGTTSQMVAYNGSGTAVTANPSTGYHFVNWSDSSTQNPRTDTGVTGNITVTANFAINTYSLNYYAGGGGSLSGSTSQTVNYGASGSAVTANPSTGYHFVNWSDGSTANPRTDSSVTANISVTANFTNSAPVLGSGSINTSPVVTNGSTQYQITVTANETDAGGGANITDQLALLNYLGTNSGTYRGYFGFSLNGNFPHFGGAYYQSPIGCSGGGQAATYNGYGSPYVNLVSCSTSVSGNTRTTIFNTAFNSSFTTPLTNNNISIYVSDAQGAAAGWLASNYFNIQTYTLTYTAGSNGTLSGTSPQTVTYGTSGSAVTANPSTGYHFVNWSDSSTQNPRTDTNVTASKSVTANFAINTYSLTVTQGSNGTISPGTTTKDYGSSQTFSITPSTGYHIVSVTVDGSNQGAIASYTFSSIQANHTITASYAINTYSLTVTQGSNGTISPGTTTKDYGTSQAFSITPSTGYHIVSVTVDGSNQGAIASYTFSSIQANHTITASYAINTYTLTYTPGSNGTISGTSPQTINYGTNGSAVTAIPNAHYHFVNWSDSSTQNPRTDTNVTANISVTANFAIDTYTLTYTAGSNGTISGTSPQTVNYGASGSAVAANPSTGYHFVNWSDSSTANPRTDSSVTANISVTANFAINTYTLTYTAGSNGTLSGTSPQTVNYGASGSAVTANPSAGYHFVNWSDFSAQNPRTDSSVSDDISVTANFGENSGMVQVNRFLQLGRGVILK